MIMTMMPLALGLPTNGLEWMFVFIVVLLLFGAKKLPELAKGLGKSIQEFKKAKEEFEHELHKAQDEPVVTPQPNIQSISPAPVATTAASVTKSPEEIQKEIQELQNRLQEFQKQPDSSSPNSSGSSDQK